MSKIERRVQKAQPVQVRSEEGKPTTIVGYAAVYGPEAVIAGMFRERIAPGAFRSVIEQQQDVRALFNHDDNIVLGRTTNGTLRLSEDERGLRYEFDPNMSDPEAVSVLAKIQRGDVSQSSYGFRVAENGDTWTKPMRAGELPLRTITNFDILRDISPVTFPAFEETTSEARSAAEGAAMVMPDDTQTEVETPADEQAENIQFASVADLLASAQTALTKAAACVAALQAGQTNEAGDDADETIERAQFAALQAQLSQVCSATSSASELVRNLLREHGDWGWYSAADLAEKRAEIDGLALNG